MAGDRAANIRYKAVMQSVVMYMNTKYMKNLETFTSRPVKKY